MATNPLLPQSSLDYLNQSPMPSGASSGATTSTIVTPPAPPISPTFSANTQSGGGSWSSPQIAQATPAPAPQPTISQVYQAPRQTVSATPTPAPTQAPQPTYDFSQDAFTPQANVSGSVESMLSQVQPAQKPFVNTYWDPGLGKYVEGNMETDRPWEKYGLGSANALYNTDPNTLRALQQRNTIGGQYGEYIQSQIKPIDEEAIRRQTMDRFQAEIDAMNRYYAEKTAGELAREQEAGRGRVGTRTAISARRGMLGGDFGDSARETVVRYNQDVENRIVNLNEKERIFQELQMRGAATEAAEKAIDKAKADLEKAYTKSQEWQEKIKGEIQERVTNRLAALAFDGTEMTDDDYQKIAKELGIDVDTVKATAFAMRPEAEKPIIAGGVAYMKQADGSFKAVTPPAASDADAPTTRAFADGTTRQWVPDTTKPTGGSWEVVATETEKPKPSGLSDPQKVSTFNSIVTNYAKSPLIAAKDRTPVLEQAIKDIEANPSDPAKQLNLSYAYIQALDTYQSAVREGELANLNSIDSKIGALGNWITQIGSGQTVRPDVAKQIAVAAKSIVDTIKSSAEAKTRMYRSQANVAGVGSEWDRFIEGAYGSDGQSSSPTPQAPTSRVPQSAVDANRQFYPDLTDDEIREVLAPDFPSVGGDTNPATGGNTPYLKTMGAITGIDGSPLWKHGLDIDLKIGDPVKSPISGTVLATRTSPKGFGKQVRVKGDDGNEYWFSHLDGFDVQAGAKIKVGEVLGRGGNTGSVIPMGGGDGSHLDLTVKDKNGKYIPPREIKKMLDKVMV